MKAYMKRYGWEFGLSMLAYTIIMISSTYILKRYEVGIYHWPLAVAPAVPLWFAVWAYIRAVREMDELQRKIHFEAIAFSAAVTLVSFSTLGFAEVRGLNHPWTILTWPVMCFSYGVGLAIFTRKYR